MYVHAQYNTANMKNTDNACTYEIPEKLIYSKACNTESFHNAVNNHSKSCTSNIICSASERARTQKISRLNPKLFSTLDLKLIIRGL